MAILEVRNIENTLERLMYLRMSVFPWRRAMLLP